MPQAIPIIAAIISAAGVGTSIYEGVKPSDQNAANQAAQKSQMTQEQQAQANQANLSKQEAVLGAQGQEQAQTGGSLTDPGTTALTDLLAGYPGYQAGSGTSTSAGTGSNGVSGGTTPASGTSGAGSTGTPDIAAILATLRGGGSGLGGGLNDSAPSSISGGNWQTQPAQPSTYFGLANPLV